MIFEDPSRKRWARTVLILSIFMVLALITAALIAAGLFITSPLPALQEKEEHRRAVANVQRELQDAQPQPVAVVDTPRRPRRPLPAPKEGAVDIRSFGTPGLPLTSAFLLQEDLQSVNSLREHADDLDLAFPDWFTLTKPTCDVKEREVPSVTAVLREHHVHVFPRLTNASDGVWRTKETQTILHSEQLRDCVAHVLADQLKRAGVQGLNLDIEALEKGDSEAYLEFVSTLATLLHAQHQALTVDVPAHDPAFDIEYIGSVADAVVLMSYDEHFAGGAAGPLASESWFADTLDEAAGGVPPQKLLVAFGAYGYDWITDSTEPANGLGFGELMSLARDINADVGLDAVSRNMHFAYDGDDGHHEVWFLNGVTAWNEWRMAQAKSVAGVSFWRLGTEDPTLWSFFGKPDATAASLRAIPGLHSIQYLSEGEILRAKDAPLPGTLDYTLDENGAVDYAQYLSLPSGYVMERVGRELPPKTLVLTFDDGPDEVWTPMILDELQRLRVPAAFFVVGDQAQKYPELVEREAAGGALIGNHTYLHPNIATISDERLRLEVNSTQRVIESAAVRKTVLFRAPYDTDTSPSTPMQLAPLGVVSRQGYIIVGANIDAEDWKRPGAAAIVATVEREAADPLNHIIVMHDAGGDRSQSLQALAQFVPELRAKGYTFVSLSDAVGLTPAELQPPLSSGEHVLAWFAGFVSTLRRWGWAVLVWLFAISTGISVLRIVLLGFFVLRSLRHEKAPPAHDPDVLVSVLIPAYNEERTIAKTLYSLAASTHTRYEAVVLNDGSEDKTAEVVRGLAVSDPRIRLISMPNAGKWSALNHGLEVAHGDIVVTIDADTLFLPGTLAELLRPFADPAVDAVCGNVEVGNVHNLLTGFQAVEYVTTQNFDRRAFDELNCIAVVPGATGAWRRAMLREIGGYSNDTLTEDTDITLKLLRAGGRVVYEPDARSRTEAPETVSELGKQRFRWSYGTYQCLWKHRGAFFHGPLGWVGLPNMFIFQVLFPILSPIGDLVFVIALLRGDVRSILAGYGLFLLLDLAGSIFAFALEGRRMQLVWLVLIQRFFYRQFMYVIAFRSMKAALRGRRHGWDKLARTGTVHAEPNVGQG